MAIKSIIDAQYLGWKATGGTRGDAFIEPIMADLLDRGLRCPNKLRRHRLEFDGHRLRIREFQQDGSVSGGHACRYRFPSIPLMDIGYAKGNSVDVRTFGIILIGYNEASSCSVHVHAWRGFSGPEAAKFAAGLAAATAVEKQQQQKQQQQKQQQQIQQQQQPPPPPPPQQQQQQRNRYCLHHRHPPEPQQQQQQQPQQQQQQDHQQDLGSLAHSLAQELRQRLNSCGAAPLLHPPRDYDTLHRSHGNAALRCSEQHLGGAIRAPNGAYIRGQLPAFVATAAAAEEEEPEVVDEPPPDYGGWEDEAEAMETDSNSRRRQVARRNNSSASGGSGSSGSSSSCRAVSDDSRWSDPWLGLSTWAAQQPKANYMDQHQ